MYAHLKSATELQLLIAVLSLFHIFAPYIVSVLWNNYDRISTPHKSGNKMKKKKKKNIRIRDYLIIIISLVACCP